MESLTFKRKFSELKWKKPFYVWSSLALGPSFILGVYSLFLAKWYEGIALTVFIPVFFKFLYNAGLRMEARINRWKSFRITIDDRFVHRDFNNEPRKSILRSEIKAIIRERSRGVRINGEENYGIWIPSDMEGYDDIIKIIESDLRTVNNQNVITEEAPPESFQKFIKMLQDNFGGISLFTTIIVVVSYIKIYFYFSLYDINVNSYIDVSEIILAFTQVYKELFLLVIFYALFYKLFEFVKMKPGRSPSMIENFAWRFQIILVIAVCGYIYYSIPEWISIKIPIDILVIQSFILAIVFLAVIFAVSILHLHSLNIKSRTRLVTMNSIGMALLFSFLLIIFAEGRISYGLNKYAHPKYSIRLFLNNNECLETTNTFVYLGGTVNYYFFHDFKTDTNTIISKNSVLKENQSKLRSGL